MVKPIVHDAKEPGSIPHVCTWCKTALTHIALEDNGKFSIMLFNYSECMSY